MRTPCPNDFGFTVKTNPDTEILLTGPPSAQLARLCLIRPVEKPLLLGRPAEDGLHRRQGHARVDFSAVLFCGSWRRSKQEQGQAERK
jgi:hypothetical protein